MASEEGAYIIVVDDDHAVADTIAAVLRTSGYETAVAYSAEEAIDFLSGHPRPLLILSDVIMPGENGIELATKVRHICPECRILLFSGNANTQDLLDQAFQTGEKFEILAKPVPPRQLLEKISSLIKSDRA